jgi:hypothetical protein
MNQRFEEIYATNAWKHGSGEGSLAEHTRGYVDFLERFLQERGITSVVEMGCGDWQFSKNVRWGATRYQGFDVVRSVIAANQAQHAREGVSFQLYSGDPAELPAAELLIVKDVLQHLSDRAVTAFLPHLSRYRYALLTNCVNPRGPTVHRDIALRLAPFHLQATEVYSFSHTMGWAQRLLQRRRWFKRVLLVEGAGAALLDTPAAA